MPSLFFPFNIHSLSHSLYFIFLFFDPSHTYTIPLPFIYTFSLIFIFIFTRLSSSTYLAHLSYSTIVMTNFLLAVAADCPGTRKDLKMRAARSIHYISGKMRKTYKFDVIRIITDEILSEQGKILTAEGLLRVLKYYISKLKKGDNLVFIFAGHGAEGSGHMGTVNGVETLDATHGIIASDLRIVSFEDLTALLEELDPSCSVTIITEACHSAGLIAGLKHQLNGEMPSPYVYKDAPHGTERSVVHMAGSTREQICHSKLYDGVAMGKFSHTLCKCFPNTVLECMTICRRIIPPLQLKDAFLRSPNFFARTFLHGQQVG